MFSEKIIPRMLLYFYQMTQYNIQSEHNDVRRFSGVVADYSMKWIHKKSLGDVHKIALIKN